MNIEFILTPSVTDILQVNQAISLEFVCEQVIPDENYAVNLNLYVNK